MVFLYQGSDKLVSSPFSFRPQCMLDSAGKVLEGLVSQRLSEHMDRMGGLASNQYGFRTGRGTMDAISAVMKTTDEAA